jgi:transposase-like protein
MEDFAMSFGSSKRKYRVWSLEEKRTAVARMEAVTHSALASELGITKRQLYSWRDYLCRLEQRTKRAGSRERVLERENQQLKAALATKVLEADFLQGVLHRIEARRQPISGSGETASIGEFIERYYNRRRLHSALDYRTPEAFEQSLLQPPAPVPVASMSFPRHEGIYRPEGPKQSGEQP